MKRVEAKECVNTDTRTSWNSHPYILGCALLPSAWLVISLGILRCRDFTPRPPQDVATFGGPPVSWSSLRQYIMVSFIAAHFLELWMIPRIKLASPVWPFPKYGATRWHDQCAHVEEEPFGCVWAQTTTGTNVSDAGFQIGTTLLTLKFR